MAETENEGEADADRKVDKGKNDNDSGPFLAGDIEEVLRYTRAGRPGDEEIVLAPVDFSPSSRAAVLEAARFCDLMKARLVVLHVVHDPGDMPGYYATLMKKKKAALIEEVAASAFDDFMTETLEHTPDSLALTEALQLMVIGLPVARIIEVVGIIEPEMVVIGSKGRTGLQQLLLGSKATQLVQMCPVSITIVKENKDSDGDA